MTNPPNQSNEHKSRPGTLAELLASGWRSRSVKEEIRENFLSALESSQELFPGIIGYQDTVLPELNIALLAGQEKAPARTLMH
ncbi:MAG: hypothetical protein ACKOAH_01970 [Pirellula sp.]